MRLGTLAAPALGTAILALSPAGAEATILVFDEARDAATHTIVVPIQSGAALPSDYGDHVTGASVPVTGGIFTYGEAGEGFTPDVTVDIFGDGATPTDRRVVLWQSDYGDLVNVVFGDGPGVDGAPGLNVLLTGESGHAVDLYGFDLAGWSNADYTVAGVEVFAGADVLYSAANVLVEGNFSGPRHTSFDFAQPLSAPEILLRIDVSNLASGVRDNVGIDSIRFGQTPRAVPEPALPWAGAALVLAAARQRRTSRNE